MHNHNIIPTPLLDISDFEGINKHIAYIKDESKNSFGTIKDRRNFFVFQEASRLKVDKLVLITSGNNGYSLAQYLKGTGIKVVCIISRDLSIEIKNALRSVAYQVIELNLNHKILRPEELIAFARETEDEVIWEVTNGYEEYYDQVVAEILEKVIPNYIIVPVGSGGLFVGVVQAIEQRGLPIKVIGLGVQNTTHSFADKLSTPWTPYSKAIESYEKFGHKVYRLNEDEVRKTYTKYKNIMVCEPSSSVVFAVNSKHQFLEDDIVVYVNSGKSANK